MTLALQNTAEWLIERLGSVGASQVGDALAVLKRGGRSKASTDLMYELAGERITGVLAKTRNALQWGIDHEDEARRAYAFLTNAEIIQPGVVRHPRIPHAHASPDALVGADGGLEIKCPTSSTHLQTLLADAVPEDRLPQVVWNLACTERAWWDFVSYDPRFPPGLQLFIKRVERDEAAIAMMEAEVERFLYELDEKINALAERYGEWGDAA
jgi:putative phage-type endonuclease